MLCGYLAQTATPIGCVGHELWSGQGFFFSFISGWPPSFRLPRNYVHIAVELALRLFFVF